MYISNVFVKAMVSIFVMRKNGWYLAAQVKRCHSGKGGKPPICGPVLTHAVRHGSGKLQVHVCAVGTNMPDHVSVEIMDKL